MSNTDRLDADYVVPKTTSSYLRLWEAKQKIRIVSSPITGWIDWDKSWEKPKPVRSKEKKDKLWEDYPKHFRAMKVWNYDANCVQIREVSQASVRNTLLALTEWEWGNPMEYDLNVRKKGKLLETEYFIQPTSDGKRPISDEVWAIVEWTECNLNALYEGLDPFESKF